MENSTLTLWHDSAEEALEADILACGGPKAVALLLWPACQSDLTEAGKKVRRILNKEHHQKFSEEEKALIITGAAKRGSRCYASYVCRLASAKLMVVAPEDRKMELVQQFDTLRGQLKSLLHEMEDLK